MNFWLELFIRESWNLLITFVHHILGGIKYSDIKLSYQRELLVRASHFQQFIGLCRSACCNVWNFLINNWQDLDVRCQSIQVSLFLAPFCSFFFKTFFSDICSDRKPCSELHALLETTPHKQISIHQKIALQYNS